MCELFKHPSRRLERIFLITLYEMYVNHDKLLGFSLYAPIRNIFLGAANLKKKNKAKCLSEGDSGTVLSFGKC